MLLANHTVFDPNMNVRDEEMARQTKIFEEILDILITAGYHRARINTLSSFDKVVGGLCWCIVNSGEAVDADILFTENLTIGERITLSEAIVNAMKLMFCPYNLQPHQIQGGVGGTDYAAVKPVIIWLIKKFLDVREEREALLRKIAVFQFSKSYKFPHENDNNVSIDLAKVLRKNKVSRQFKRSVSDKEESEETKVHSCLLEYGEKVIGNGGKSGGGKDDKNSKGDKDSSSMVGMDGFINIGLSEGGILSNGSLSGKSPDDLSKFEKKLMQEAAKAQREQAAYDAKFVQQETELLESMDLLEDGDENIQGKSIGSLIVMGSDSINLSKDKYMHDMEENKKIAESNIQGGVFGKEIAYQRQKQKLKEKQDQLDVKQAEAQTKADEIESILNEFLRKKEIASQHREDLEKQLKDLMDAEAQSSDQQREDLARLKDLVILNESLKIQEGAFKSNCKSQMTSLKEQIRKLESAENDEDNEENQKLKSIEDMHANVMEKYNRLLSTLAETNLEVSSNTRVIDDIPTRTELIQYERRFQELYQQVAWKLEETRKYYALYNSLDKNLQFLQKNVRILNSIHENFTEAMSSSQGKEEFLNQIATIKKGVEESLQAQTDLLTQKEQQVEQSNSIYQVLVDQQRAYFQAVKDFQSECDKNSWLAQKLEEAA
jgi:hypothetical protein